MILRRFLNFLALFGSAGTLVCCALPALFVSIGMGATVAGAVSAVPELIWLSERKGFLFAFCAAMLALAGWMQWRARFEPCPLDPDLARACTGARRWSLGVYLASLLLFVVGAGFAYVLPAVMLLLG